MSKKAKSKKASKPVTSKPAKNAAEYVARGKHRKLAIAAKTEATETPMQAGLAAVSAMKPEAEKSQHEGRLTKLVRISELLKRPEGATLDEILDVTGWQKHTARAAISYALGKKRGYNIVSEKPKGGKRTYKITGEKEKNDGE